MRLINNFIYKIYVYYKKMIIQCQFVLVRAQVNCKMIVLCNYKFICIFAS